MDYEKKIRDYMNSSEVDQLYKSMLSNLFPELKESEEEGIRKELIEQVVYIVPNDDEVDSEGNVLPTYQKRIDKYIAWLENQSKQKPLYIRFGDVPSNEKSKIYRGEIEVGNENGVSVYPAFEVNGDIVLGLTLPITKTTLYTQQHLLEYDNRPCYLVSGDYVGKGTDGEPLIRNISIIKRLDNHRIKDFEKQGEQKPVPKFKVGDVVRSSNGASLLIVGITDYCYNCVTCATNDEYSFGFDIQDEFELVEQKPVDKVEPKFEVGDWICHTLYKKPLQIIEDLGEGDYRTYPNSIVTAVELKEGTFRRWTINDAKTGDVLCTYECGKPKIVFILKGAPEKPYVLGYHCYYNIMYPHFEFDSEKGCLAPNEEDVKPATKEQRDTLMKAMADAGYTFDFEKKELKKIEQKLAEWSEEDERMWLSAIEYIRTYPAHTNSVVDWLKSLKDRVQPQTTWKPTKKQIIALRWVLNNVPYNKYKEEISGLLDQIKDL